MRVAKVNSIELVERCPEDDLLDGRWTSLLLVLLGAHDNHYLVLVKLYCHILQIWVPTVLNRGTENHLVGSLLLALGGIVPENLLLDLVIANETALVKLFLRLYQISLEKLLHGHRHLILDLLDLDPGLIHLLILVKTVDHDFFNFVVLANC